MAKAKVIVDFSANRYSDLELKNTAETIGENLLHTPQFQGMTEIANNIRIQAADFGTWLIQMRDGNKQVTLSKNQSRALLEGLLSTAAVKVQDISNGDEKLILDAGFEVKRKPAPVGLLERPANVVANPGPRRGSLEISWDVVPNARLYELEIIESPVTDKSVRQRLSTTKHKMIIDDLIRGQAYSIAVAGAGSDPGRVWSDAIISYVM
ncbi:hypothetical protein Palpr_0664 [Paludibacter propionicigenes WB4]|uniref:Fibronectin type-III domain-containing protein n=1 Tax=Paludibacter propionicigenes (strain DSM 17365 / JCM 13257 / WB4) TaxID=694427 RepID=E4T276_PALPW|nr:hypothetical protein [Paludibacter propionicigenes]ADQ78820.1 hypothetical protein Palpr_0664 [Paludibacter propionicigenes WB4]